MHLIPLDEIEGCKADLFRDLNQTFDYAVPQDWLNDFSAWSEARGGVTYHQISATTVWGYPESQPVFACIEVAAAHAAWEAYEKGIEND